MRRYRRNGLVWAYAIMVNKARYKNKATNLLREVVTGPLLTMTQGEHIGFIFYNIKTTQRLADYLEDNGVSIYFINMFKMEE